MSSNSPSNRESGHDSRLRLSSSAPGRPLLVTHVGDSEDSFRLRELGIFEGNTLQLLRAGDPLLVLVGESRLAVDPLLARLVEVSCV